MSKYEHASIEKHDTNASFQTYNPWDNLHKDAYSYGDHVPSRPHECVAKPELRHVPTLDITDMHGSRTVEPLKPNARQEEQYERIKAYKDQQEAQQRRLDREHALGRHPENGYRDPKTGDWEIL